MKEKRRKYRRCKSCNQLQQDDKSKELYCGWCLKRYGTDKSHTIETIACVRYNGPPWVVS